jgi:polysaccharide export outer membrane protein
MINRLQSLSLLLWLITGLAGCVPAKKVVYLQNDDLRHRKGIVKDSVLRTHELDIKEIKIQPLDVLNISFESLTTEEFDFFAKSAPNVRSTSSGAGSGNNLSGILVDTEGNIEYPVVGKIKLAGLTIFQAQNKLQEVAAKYLRDVIVRLRITNFRYTMLGEVNGEKTITVPTVRLTMMEAITMGGGLSELADRSNVKVIRQVGDKTEVYYINLLEEKFIESPYYYVQQNDVIIVPPLRQRTFKRYFMSNLGLITSGLSAILFIISVTKL